jgi:SAM-dependent methyltransferase
MNNNSIDRELIKEIYQERFSKSLVLHPHDPQLIYLLNFLPKDKNVRILDAGCGDGRYSDHLANIGYRHIDAVDLFEKSPVPSVSYQAASIDELPFENQTFDFIFSNSVVFYIDPPSKALAELSRVLKPGGLLLFTAHTKWSLFTLQRWVKRDLLRLRQMSHLSGIKFYSASYYKNILERLKLKVLLRDGWRLSFFFYPLYLSGATVTRKIFGIELPKIPTFITRNPIIGAIKSEVAYHSIFVAEKTDKPF